MSHTPGPWVAAEPTDGNFFIRSVGATLARLDHYPKWSREQRKCNAEVMAAAPDLLDAIRGLFAVIPDNVHEKYHDNIQKAEAAIAKAEGRQS